MQEEQDLLSLEKKRLDKGPVFVKTISSVKPRMSLSICVGVYTSKTNKKICRGNKNVAQVNGISICP